MPLGGLSKLSQRQTLAQIEYADKPFNRYLPGSASGLSYDRLMKSKSQSRLIPPNPIAVAVLK
jgi:hypothetical protein